MTVVVDQVQDKERVDREPPQHSVAGPDALVAGNASDVLSALPQLEIRQSPGKVFAHTLQDTLHRVLLTLVCSR